jgi:D-alanyl-lipoteichoic acid acyltransferase DltB (MBOAT superfamily)
MTTMFISGVWHGAGRTFLLWGILHGFYISVNHAWHLLTPPISRFHKIVPAPFMVALTYLSVLFGQVFFRANSFRDAWSVLADMAGRHGLGPAWPLSQTLVIVGLFAVVWLMPNTQEILNETPEGDSPNWSFIRIPRWSPTLPWWVVTSLTFALSMFYSAQSTTFLYFQF